MQNYKISHSRSHKTKTKPHLMSAWFGVPLFFIITKPFQCYFFEYLVRVCFVYLHYFHWYCLCFMSRTYLYWIWSWLLQLGIFKNAKTFVESKFLISANYLSSVIHIANVSTYLLVLRYRGVSVYWPLSALCVFVCVSVWY